MLQHHCCFGRLIVAFLFRKIAVAFSFTSCCTTAAVAKVATPACNAIATAAALHVLLALAACCFTFAGGWLLLFEKNSPVTGLLLRLSLLAAWSQLLPGHHDADAVKPASLCCLVLLLLLLLQQWCCCLVLPCHHLMLPTLGIAVTLPWHRLVLLSLGLGVAWCCHGLVCIAWCCHHLVWHCCCFVLSLGVAVVGVAITIAISITGTICHLWCGKFVEHWKDFLQVNCILSGMIPAMVPGTRYQVKYEDSLVCMFHALLLYDTWLTHQVAPGMTWSTLYDIGLAQLVGVWISVLMIFHCQDSIFYYTYISMVQDSSSCKSVNDSVLQNMLLWRLPGLHKYDRLSSVFAGQTSCYGPSGAPGRPAKMA